MAPGPLFSPGFSLIELLVAISIIVLLIAIGVVGMSRLYGQADRQATQTLLGTLQSISTEYTAQTGGSVVPFRVPSDGNYNDNAQSDVDSIRHFVEVVYNNAQPAFEMMDKGVPRRFFVDELTSGASGTVDARGVADGIKDSWGNYVRYYPGRSYGGGDQTAKGLRNRNQPYFASAGPDGQWGEFGNDDQPAGNDDGLLAEDNLYSFEVE